MGTETRVQGKPSAASRRESDRQQEVGGMHGTALAQRPGTTLLRVSSGPVTAIQVAVPRPPIKELAEMVYAEFEMLGEEAWYAWEVNDKNSPTGKGIVEGLTVEAAEVMERLWGNCTTEIEIVAETPTHWIIEARFVDFERGFVKPRLFKQRKSERGGDSMQAERAQDIAFQIGMSKATRNAVLHAMPAWMKEEALRKARNAATARYQDVPAAIGRMRKAARMFGVTDEELMAKWGKRFTVSEDGVIHPGDWTPDDLMTMAAIFRAIHKKQSTVGAEFRKNAPKPAPKQQSAAQAEQAAAEQPPAAGLGGDEGEEDEDEGEPHGGADPS